LSGNQNFCLSMDNANEEWDEVEHKRAVMMSIVERQSEKEHQYWEEYFAKLDALEYFHLYVYSNPCNRTGAQGKATRQTEPKKFNAERK
jgi:hypothetical protein